MQIQESELRAIEKELCDHLGRPSVEAADFATRKLARLLGEYRQLVRENRRLQDVAKS